MATFTAIANGNWNAWATWFAGDPGGGEGSQYPGNGDVADCAGYNITMNLTTTPASGVLGEMKSTGAGYFRWDNTAGGAMVVNCTKFTVGGTGAGAAGVFQVNATTAGYTLTINSSSTSGEGIIGATGGSNPYGFVKATGTQNFTYSGRITGGTGSNGLAIRFSSTGTNTINGNVYGGTGSSAFGIIVSNSNVYINCTEITGSSATAALAHSSGTATISISPLAPATSYTLKGTAGAPALYLFSTTGATFTLNSDCFFDESAGTALWGKPPSWTITPNEMITLGTNKFAALVAAADLKSGVINGDVTGTYKGGAGARMKQIGIGVF